MYQPDQVESHGPSSKPFQPTLADSEKLLTIMGDFTRDFAIGTDPQLLFDNLLTNILQLTDSEYGFIGERLLRATGEPYLKTHAITNIAWNQETRDFYAKHAPEGMEFDNLNSLFGYVIRTGQPLISNEPISDQHATGIPKGHPPLTAFMGIPLYLGEHFLGMAGVANRPGGYDIGLLRFISPLINSTAALIHAARLGKMAYHDPLTGLANRRKILERFSIEVSRNSRNLNALSLLLIDIDRFKKVNDSYGHLTGDLCLKQIADLLTSQLRKEDLAGRYGGEEFAVLLPDTPLPEARSTAEKLRHFIAENPLPLENGTEKLHLTVSIGVATLERGSNTIFDDLLSRADQALLSAKANGRNLVCCTPPVDADPSG